MLTGPIGLYPGGVTNKKGHGVKGAETPPIRNPVGGFAFAGPLSFTQQVFPSSEGEFSWTIKPFGGTTPLNSTVGPPLITMLPPSGLLGTEVTAGAV
jgi:hypothetical protein